MRPDEVRDFDSCFDFAMPYRLACKHVTQKKRAAPEGAAQFTRIVTDAYATELCLSMIFPENRFPLFQIML
jgi:hypothetical protein